MNTARLAFVVIAAIIVSIALAAKYTTVNPCKLHGVNSDRCKAYIRQP